MRTTITADRRRAGALPISQCLIRTQISVAAYGAIAASRMRLLLQTQRGPHGGYFLWLDEVTLNKITAARGSSEDFGDVVIAKAEAMALNRSPVATAFRA